jgi:hypothetical protein
MSPLNMDPDCWDDAAILDIFDDAIRSHRTKVVCLLHKMFDRNTLSLLQSPIFYCFSFTYYVTFRH